LVVEGLGSGAWPVCIFALLTLRLICAIILLRLQMNGAHPVPGHPTNCCEFKAGDKKESA